MPGNSQKVISAVRYAREKEKNYPVFDVSQGTTIHLTFNGGKLFEIDSLVEANSFALIMNASILPAFGALKTYYDKKVDSILNA